VPEARTGEKWTSTRRLLRQRRKVTPLNVADPI
jgi:hypothetical protein